MWRNLNFQLTWSSVAASGFGDRLIQLAAYPLLGMNQVGADAASIQAGVFFFFFLPFIFIGPIGGYLADTLPRKWIMFVCDEGRALVLALAVGLLLYFAPNYQGQAIAPDHPLASFAYLATYGILMLTGVFAAVFGPTRDAMVPQIVPLRQLQSANAIILAIASTAAMIGLGVGGWIISEFSIAAAVIVGFACYLITGSFWAFLRIAPHPRPTGKRPSELARLIAALSYVRQHRSLVGLFALNISFWCLAYLVLGALAALCKLRYGLDETQLISAIGTMQAMLGLGMLLSSILLALLPSLRESHWLMLAALTAAGCCVLLLWINPLLTLGWVLAFGVGFAGNVTRVCTDTLTQAIAANYMRGRVFGLREVLNTAAGLTVNLCIWQLPGADARMITLLPFLATLIILLAGWGTLRAMGQGPAPKRLVNMFWRFNRAYCFVWHRLRFEGRHHVPFRGPVILAANHTTGLDPFLIQAGCLRTVRWLMLTSYQFRILSPLWRSIQPIALEQDGSDLAQIRAVIRRLKDNDIVGLFPEGRLQRDQRELAPFQDGIAMIAQRTGAVIVPVWIEGTPLWKHMFWHFALRGNCVVRFGKPYTPDPKAEHREVTEELRRRMVELKGTADR